MDQPLPVRAGAAVRSATVPPAAAWLHAALAPASVAVAGPGAGALADALCRLGVAADARAEGPSRALGVLLAGEETPTPSDAMALVGLLHRADRVLLCPPPAATPGVAEAWIALVRDHGLHPEPACDAGEAGAGAFLAVRPSDAAAPDHTSDELLARLLRTRARLDAMEERAERRWARARLHRARMLTAEAAASRMFRQLAEANWQHSKIIGMLREEGLATEDDTVSAKLGGRARGMIQQLAQRQEAARLELVRLNERNEWHEADLARLRHHLDNLPPRVALAKLWAALLRRLPRALSAPLAKGTQLLWWTATRQLGTRLHQRAVLREEAELVRRSPHFDVAWYGGQHPELAASGADPALHYLLVGVTNRFDPGPRFGTREYLRDHPEVEASGTNPLVHLARLEPSRQRPAP